MTVTPKFQELLSRVDKDELLIKLLEGQVDEQIAKSAGLRSKSEDPPTPAAPAEPTTAELTDAEASAIAAKLAPTIQDLIKQEFAAQQTAQATAATKAQEPITKALETVQNDVTAIKATFARLLGEQPAAHQYRASGDPSTVVNKADDDPLAAAEAAAKAERERLHAFITGNKGGA